MYRLRGNLLRYLIFSILTLLVCTPLALHAQAAESEPTVIRVGYTLNYGTIKSPVVSGSEGYGYEYLNKIFEYAKGDYQLEFVYCEWTETADMLRSGEIDLLGPTTMTEWGLENFLYPDESFGVNAIFLSTLTENSTIYHDIPDIDGSIIAVQENNPNEYMLHEFLEENGLTAQIVYFTDNDYASVMEHFNYDFCLCSSLQTSSSLSPVAVVGTTDFYYTTNQQNQALIDVINEAVADLNQSEFLYQEKLYLKYYDHAFLTSTAISSAEYDLLQSQDCYYIGVDNIYGPICYLDEQGLFRGIAVDVIEMLASAGGFQYELVDISLLEEHSPVWDTLDFALLSYSTCWPDENISSDIYCQMPFVLVEHYLAEGETAESVGSLPHYGIQEVADGDTLFNRTIHYYEDVRGLVEAYNNYEIDSMILTTSTLNLMRSDFESAQYLSTTLDMDLNLSISFPADYDSEKIVIFNKLIAQLDDIALESSMLTHSSQVVAPLTLKELILSYPLILISVILTLAGSIIFFQHSKRRAVLHQLNYDELTGLSTRHHFIQRCREILARPALNRYAILSVDIDNFKYINELFGYEEGNALLRQVAFGLQEYATNSLAIARGEADTFYVLAQAEEGTDCRHYSFVNRVYQLSQFYIGLANTYNISFSVGIYPVDDPTQDIHFMMDCANIARCAGKAEANTTVTQYDGEMDSQRILTNDIVRHMAEALEHEDFLLLYQPKIQLSTGKIVGGEALVRWSRGGKLVPPGRFIPIFEKNRFIVPLDYYTFNKACTFLAAHPNIPIVSVNLSGVTLSTSDVVERLLEITHRHQLTCNRLDIELTETAFLHDSAGVIEKVAKLRSEGFLISMDDFGVGISTLSRLKNLPLDVLKIDREFIIDCIENQRGEMILKNILNMAKDLQLETVAEGIETQRQATFLTNLGCDVGQGYLFSRPIPESEFVAMIEKNEG